MTYQWWYRRVVLGLALLSAAVGCSTQRRPAVEPVYDLKPAGDEAMAVRQWPRSVSYYPSGGVTAFSTRFPHEYKRTHERYTYLFLDPMLFIGQTVALPLNLVANPPGKFQVYRGAVYPPTYTAQPPPVVPQPIGRAGVGVAGQTGTAGPVYPTPSNSGYVGGGGAGTPVGPGNAPAGVPGAPGGGAGGGAAGGAR